MTLGFNPAPRPAQPGWPRGALLIKQPGGFLTPDPRSAAMVRCLSDKSVVAWRRAL